jgi:peptidoglycan/xylan/chitin deacetylase (PgdA/CDA1 family)
VIDAGHCVANHTYNHLAGWSTDLHVYLENVHKCEREIQRHHNPGEQRSRLFRPPYGRITPAQVRALKQEYKIVMWSLLANDFVQAHSSERSLQQLFRHTRPGSIVLFHDSIKTEKKLKYMLPRFLQFGIEEGYTFKMLD